MKNTIKAAACLAAFASLTAHAETFDFSYNFGDGQAVTGSLNGDLVGDTVENVSNVQVSFDGAFTSPLLVGGLNSATGIFDGPATVSTDVSKNNFAFGDTLDGTWTNVFFMTDTGGTTDVLAVNANQLQSNTDFDVTRNASWSLQPVPLPGALLLLGSGLGLFGATRRRQAT